MESKLETTTRATETIRFQAQLLNAVEQAVIATDLADRIIFWNRFAETLYGWTADEAQGRSMVELTVAFGSTRQNAEIIARMQRGERWSGEYLMQRRDGSTFTAYVAGSPILDEQGARIGLVSISHNSAAWNKIHEANRLLAETDALHAASLADEVQLTALAQLAVPQLADWCAVHLINSDGSLAQVALAPLDAATLPTAHDWLMRELPTDDTHGLPAVLRKGEPLLITDVTPDLLAAKAAITSYMIVPLISLPQRLGAITFVATASGRRFDVNTLALAENLARHVAIYLDKVRLYHESQQLHAELEQRVGKRTNQLLAAVGKLKQSEATIQTLFRISKKLNATLDVDSLLDELAQEAIQIVNGESGFAGLGTAAGMTIRKYFQAGAAIAFDHTWPPGQDIPGWVLQYKVPYGTSDAVNDPVILHELAINANVRSVICTPVLNSMGEVLAYFDIRNKKGGEGFTLDDQEMLMALSPAASIAIQNALAYQQRLQAEGALKDSYAQLRALAAELQSVREAERTRIARELHDELGQALTALKFDLAWLTNQLVKKDVTLGQRARDVTAQMDTLIKTVRRIATELRPGMLDDLGLAASIEWQAREFQKHTGIPCEVRVPPHHLALAGEQATALFRIFQETLTNVARHAEAQHVVVKLESRDGSLLLQIHDDGRGVRADEIVGTRSLGLLGMRERAELLGGEFNIRGAPGAGTTVTVTLPLKRHT